MFGKKKDLGIPQPPIKAAQPIEKEQEIQETQPEHAQDPNEVTLEVLFSGLQEIYKVMEQRFEELRLKISILEIIKEEREKSKKK